MGYLTAHAGQAPGPTESEPLRRSSPPSWVDPAYPVLSSFAVAWCQRCRPSPMGVPQSQPWGQPPALETLGSLLLASFLMAKGREEPPAAPYSPHPGQPR